MLTAAPRTPPTDRRERTGATAVNKPSPEPAVQLDDLVEAYFEDELELNPLLATFIGDHRYDDQLPNILGPEQRALARATEPTLSGGGARDRSRRA